MPKPRVYVGGLPRDATEKELEKEFKYYGTLVNVWVAGSSGFAFLEYEDQKDADDAIKEMDGKVVCGVRVRVEHARSEGPRANRGGRDDMCYSCGERGHFAYECRRRPGAGWRRSRSRSRSADRRRRRSSRSRSRSRGRAGRDRRRRSPSRSRSRSRSHSRSRSRSRSRSNSRR